MSLNIMRSISFLIATLLAGSLFAAGEDDGVRETKAWRTEHEPEILAEFSDLLAIPNLASDQPNIQKNADFIKAMMEKRGLATQLLSLGKAPPIVVGDLIAPSAKRTIAFYAHYDGQPVDPTK